MDPRNGEIYFSETPPPPEVTTEYENVSHKLEKPSLTRQAQPEKKKAKPAAEVEAPKAVEEAPEVPSDTALLLLHKCQDLTAQIDSLERRIVEAEDPDTMDALIVSLANREKAFNKVCKQ